MELKPSPLKKTGDILHGSKEKAEDDALIGLFVAGEICPFCGQGKLEYDGMLNLICPVCGKMETGGCT